MSDWSFDYAYDGVDVPLSVSYRNTTGAACQSCEGVEPFDQGAMLTPAGVFVVTVGAGPSVTIAPGHPLDYRSPVLFEGSLVVVADGATPTLDLIPGVSIVLSEVIAEGDVFEVGVGCIFDEDTLTWYRVLPLDSCAFGVDGSERTVSVFNDSGRLQSDSLVYATNAIRLVNIQGASRPFYAFRQAGRLNPTAHNDPLGRVVSFDSFVAGTPNTVQVLVNGSGISITDVATGVVLGVGAQLDCDGSTAYRFSDGTPYQSGEFVLSTSLTVSDTATIYVSDGGDFVQLASPTGDWVNGASGVYVTEVGCYDGVVGDGKRAEFRMRASAPVDRDTTLNQRVFSLRIDSRGI